MSFESTVAELSFVTNGATTTFGLSNEDGSLYFMSAADIRAAHVSAAGVVTDLANGSDFDVTGDGRTGDGELETAVALATGNLRIWCETPAVQPESYQEDDGFPAATHERAQDRHAMQGRDVRRAIAYAPHFPYADGPLIITEYVAAADRAGKLAAFDDDGGVTVSTRTLAEIEAAAGGEDVIAELEALLQSIEDSGVLLPGFSYSAGVISVDDGTRFGINNTAPDGLLHVGPNSAASEADPAIALARSITGTSNTNAHGYVDVTEVYRSGGLVGYAAYDAWSKFKGSANFDHMAGYQSRISHDGTGTVDAMYCSFYSGTINGLGAVTAGYGTYISGFSPGFGTLAASYGLWISDISAGAGNAYSAYFDGAGKIRMNTQLGIGGDPTVNHPLDVTAAPSVGSWRCGIRVKATDYPSYRAYASGSDKWSGWGNNNDGSFVFLVGASGPTGSPLASVGYFGPTGGLVLGAPTGGDLGAGWLNVSNGIKKNNTAYTNPHGGFEMGYSGQLVMFKDRMANIGLADYRPLSLDALEDYTRQHFHFPGFEDEANNDYFVGGERHLLITEELAIHLFDMNRRLKALEKPLWRKLWERLTNGQ